MSFNFVTQNPKMIPGSICIFWLLYNGSAENKEKGQAQQRGVISSLRLKNSNQNSTADLNKQTHINYTDVNID